MAIKRGLRLRVALTLVLLSLLLTVIQTVAVFVVTDGQEEEFIDRIVQDEMEQLVYEYSRDPQLTPWNGSHIDEYIVRTPEDRDKLPAPLRGLPPGLHEVFDGAQEFHVAVREVAGVTLYVAYDATTHEQRIREFAMFLSAGVVASVALTVLLGYWLSGLLVRQVSDLAARVVRLNPEEERPALADLYRDDEVNKLAAAFDQYHMRVAQLMQREKEFTADVSHELRTRLTSILTSCELLLGDSQLSAKARRRAQSISEAANEITRVTQDLLLLAREAPSDEAEPVNVREAVEDALAPWRGAIAEKGLQLRIEVPPGALLRVYRPALQLALANLVRNAVAYTERGSITIAFAQGELAVTDTGCGIADLDLPHILSRFYRGRSAQREGSGLGLAIVKRVADRFGWSLHIASQMGEGSTFALHFPPSLQIFQSNPASSQFSPA